MANRVWIAVFLGLLTGCGPGDDGVLDLPDHGEPPELTGALVGFDAAAVIAANAAALPPGFTMPRETVCAADVTRGFIQEIVDHGFEGAQVAYEWAPVSAGPITATPTIRQPEFYASGVVSGFDSSGLDFRPPHPFGFDTTWNVHVDGPFAGLVHNRPGDSSVD